MSRAPRFALAVASFALAMTAGADELYSLPTLPSLPGTSAPAVVVPVAPSSSGGAGTVYYDDGSTVYGSDGSTATRYGDLIHVVPGTNYDDLDLNVDKQ